ncbi:MAG TPA: T9SS type A sorting domain-containing protein [Phaeodactylibacter sp.]|nr:T9SS type A sorting domain-containing protein [Phaeodactylibacter sp.]
MTETTIPRKSFEDFIGSDEAARNYAMKVQIAAYQNGIRQVALYQLADQAIFDDAQNWLEMSGLYQQISTVQPYEVTLNESGIACRTMTQMLWGRAFDPNATDALNLSDEVRGGAFIDMQMGDTIYVLWAKTEMDQSESASASFSFPSNLNFTTVEKREWNHSVTDEVTILNPDNIALNGTPLFFKGVIGGDPVNTHEVDLTKTVLVLPNPFGEFFQLKFELIKLNNVNLEIYNVQGMKIYEWSENDMLEGEHTILINELKPFSAGMYFGKLTIDGKKSQTFKLLKMQE